MIKVTPALRRTFLFIAAFVVFSAALQLEMSDYSYQRTLMWSEPWRLWTAHWVHLNWRHFWLNMLALFFLPLIFPHLKKNTLIWALLGFSLLLSVAFYICLPQLQSYAGLSGVLHSLYVFVALQSVLIARERHFALLVLVCAVLKVSWEKIQGQSESAQFLHIPVLLEAHQLGFLLGLMVGVLYLIRASIKQRRVNQVVETKV